MFPKVIKNEVEYEATLSRIEALLDADPGTPEGDELELLVTLVDLYEKTAHPIDLPDPIEAIKFRMEQAELKQKDLVPFIGSRSKVSEVLSGQRPLSLPMIRKLHQGLGIPAEVLLKEPGAGIPEALEGVEWVRCPLAEMLKRGWLPDVGGTLAAARKQAEDLLTTWAAPQAGRPATRPAAPARALGKRRDPTPSPPGEFASHCWPRSRLCLHRRDSHPGFRSRPGAPDYLDNGPCWREYLLKRNSLRGEPHLSHTPGWRRSEMPDGSPLVA
jgi:HTH-type transcriptional regulator/antitoxin HigA